MHAASLGKAVVAALMLWAGTLTAAGQGAVPAAALKDLAPTGKLRAAINFDNAMLAQRDPNGGPAKGVTADLAREPARRLGVWDIAFIAIEPVRAAEISFTRPYMLIEKCC